MPNDNHIKIFIAYSREDTDILKELRKNLVVLERTQDIDVWYDGEIEAGSNWADSIKEELHSADIILLLISQNFIASDYCYDTEMIQALALHEAGKVKVIPIIARECLWQDTPFAKLQAIPPDGKPIMSKTWETVNRPYFLIANELKEAVNRIRHARKPISKIPKPAIKINRPDPVVQKAETPSSASQSFVSTKAFKIGLPVLLLAVLGIWLGLKFFTNSGNATPDKTEATAVVEDPSSDDQTLYDDFIKGGDDYLRKAEYASAKGQYEFASGIAEKRGLNDSDAKEGISSCDREIQKIKDEKSEAVKEREFDRYKKAGDADFNIKKYRPALENYNKATEFKFSDDVNARIKECNAKIKAEGGGSTGGGGVIPDRGFLNPEIAKLDVSKITTRREYIPIGDAIYSKNMTDPRDKQNYKVIRLKDGKIWMAQNLNYNAKGSTCFKDNQKNCDFHGRLYPSKGIVGICPDGWKIPSKSEWEYLIKLYGGKKDAYKKLTLDKEVGFNATLGGVKSSQGKYVSYSNREGFYTSDKSLSGYPIYASFQNKEITFLNYTRNLEISCRCVKK